MMSRIRRILERRTTKGRQEALETPPPAEDAQPKKVPEQPLVSVIVPVYNVEKYLEECLDSILDQDLQALEVVAVNDGSTDSSPEILADRAKTDTRIRVITQPNRGLAATRNTGIRESRGKYLFFVDSDDLLPDGVLRKLVLQLERSGSDMAIGPYGRYWDQRLRKPSEWIRRAHEKTASGIAPSESPSITANVVACSKLYRSEFWRRNELAFPEGVLYEDQYVAARAYTLAQKIDIVTYPVLKYRVRDDGSSITQQQSELTNLAAFIEQMTVGLDIYENSGKEELYRARICQLLENDIPHLISVVLKAGDTERAEMTNFINHVHGRLGSDNWHFGQLEQRVAICLAEQGNWADIVRARQEMQTKGVDKCGWQGDVPAAELNRHDSWAEKMPRDLLRLTPSEYPLRAAVEHIEWSDTGSATITGWAYLSHRGYDPDRCHTDLWLEDRKTGERHSLPIRRVQAPQATEWSTHSDSDYVESGFVASVEVDRLLELTQGVGRSFDIGVRVEYPEMTCEGKIDRIFRNGSARATNRFHRTVGTPPMIVDFSISARYPARFTIRPLKVRAIELQSQYRQDRSDYLLSGLLDARPDLAATGMQVEMAEQGADRRHRSSVTASHDGLAFELVLPVDGPEAVDTLHKYSLHLLDAKGRREPVIWVDQQELTPTVNSSTAGTGQWRRATSGVTQFVSGFTPCSLDSVKKAGQNRLALLLNGPQELDGQKLQFRLTRHGQQIHPITVTTLDGTGTTVIFELTAAPFGGPIMPLTSGDYQLLADTDSSDDRPLSVGLTPRMERERLPNVSVGDLFVEVMIGRSAAAVVRVSAAAAQPGRSAYRQQILKKRYWSRCAPVRDAVLFQSYKGEVVTDAQLALCRELRTRRPDLELICAVRDAATVVPEATHPVVIGSPEWYDTLADVRYLCNNIEFDRYFEKREHQTFIQTFHGHPFKAMGLSYWRHAGVSSYAIELELERRHRNWDYVIAGSSLGEWFFRREFRYDGKVLCLGDPRDDSIVNCDAEKRISIRRALGVGDDQIAVLFAPTFRESLSNVPWTAQFYDGLDLGTLAHELGEQYVILARGHNYNLRAGSLAQAAEGVIDVSAYPDVNELISAGDFGIFDYSSIRFDWALTGRPACFFVPDFDEYFAIRPGLFDFDISAPWPKCYTLREVVDAIRNRASIERDSRIPLAEFNASFNRDNDGRAAARVVEAVFGA